jgi:hypothetical protein
MSLLLSGSPSRCRPPTEARIWCSQSARSTAVSTGGTNYIRPPANRSGFRGWLMGFRPLQVSRALAKAAVASVRDGGAVAVEGYAMVPTHARQHRSHFWTFVVVGRLSGAQMCRRRHHGRRPARLEGLHIAGSPPLSGFSGGSQTCSSRLQQQACDLALLNAPIRGWPGTNGAQRGPLRRFASSGLGFESLGSTPVSLCCSRSRRFVSIRRIASQA